MCEQVLAGVGENGLQSNVVSVRESDFEVFEALAVDIVSNGEEKQRLRSGSPVGEYSQDIPSRSSLSSNLTGPPVLPPHLLQVMLNKEVPCHVRASCHTLVFARNVRICRVNVKLSYLPVLATLPSTINASLELDVLSLEILFL